MGHGDKLEELLEATKGVIMTPEEMEAQRRSFAYGNCNIENPDVTRETVDRAAQELAYQGNPEANYKK